MTTESAPASIAGSGSSKQLIHQTLRAATRTEHRLLDACLSKLDLGDRCDYRAFLTIHQWSLALLAHRGRPEDYREFSRLAELVNIDLAALGAKISTPEYGQSPQSNASASFRWGVSYVLRGSRLGAKFLQQRVAPGFAASYLNSAMDTSWHSFLHDLECHVDRGDANGTQQIIDGALAAFAVFSTMASRVRVDERHRIVGT